MGQWQPIETAPRDGTPVLLWCTGDGGYTTGPVIGLWDAEKMHFSLCLFHKPLPVSHWQPLPEPPQAS